MDIIQPSFEIVTPSKWMEEALQLIEKCGRVCYKSENYITEDSAKRFVSNLVGFDHTSVLEHFSISVRIICDRGVSHELVRHRLASYSQESTRYCNYTKDKFSNRVTFIDPYYLPLDSEEYKIWKENMQRAESDYFKLITLGRSGQEARAVLPNSLKTEIIVTANLREWRKIFELRCPKRAHPQMRQIMLPLLSDMHNIIPEIFESLHDIYADDILEMEEINYKRYHDLKEHLQNEKVNGDELPKQD